MPPTPGRSSSRSRRQTSNDNQGDIDLDPSLRNTGNPGAQTQHNEEHFTLGTLAEAQDQVDELESSPQLPDPLTAFARSVIDSERPMGDEEHNIDEDLFVPEHEIQGILEDAEAMQEETEALARAHSAHGSGGEEPGPVSRKDSSQGRQLPTPISTAQKRKRNVGSNGGLVAEESRDLARIKKDSHKEVERKRRDNINEGIMAIGRLVPNCSEKLGKGQMLKAAADYLAELTAGKVNNTGGESTHDDAEFEKLQTELTQTQTLLAEEQVRNATIDRSWQEAEERAAKSQFELERVKKELEDARLQLLENRR